MKPVTILLGATAVMLAFVEHAAAAPLAFGFLARPETPCAAPLVRCI
jgi:hypothetical protein